MLNRQWQSSQPNKPKQENILSFIFGKLEKGKREWKSSNERLTRNPTFQTFPKRKTKETMRILRLRQPIKLVSFSVSFSFSFGQSNSRKREKNSVTHWGLPKKGKKKRKIREIAKLKAWNNQQWRFVGLLGFCDQRLL